MPPPVIWAQRSTTYDGQSKRGAKRYGGRGIAIGRNHPGTTQTNTNSTSPFDLSSRLFSGKPQKLFLQGQGENLLRGIEVEGRIREGKPVQIRLYYPGPAESESAEP